jgi:hypothetical protein
VAIIPNVCSSDNRIKDIERDHLVTTNCVFPSPYSAGQPDSVTVKVRLNGEQVLEDRVRFCPSDLKFEQYALSPLGHSPDVK